MQFYPTTQGPDSEGKWKATIKVVLVNGQTILYSHGTYANEDAAISGATAGWNLLCATVREKLDMLGFIAPVEPLTFRWEPQSGQQVCDIKTPVGGNVRLYVKRYPGRKASYGAYINSHLYSTYTTEAAAKADLERRALHAQAKGEDLRIDYPPSS